MLWQLRLGRSTGRTLQAIGKGLSSCCSAPTCRDMTPKLNTRIGGVGHPMGSDQAQPRSAQQFPNLKAHAFHL